MKSFRSPSLILSSCVEAICEYSVLFVVHSMSMLLVSFEHYRLTVEFDRGRVRARAERI